MGDFNYKLRKPEKRYNGRCRHDTDEGNDRGDRMTAITKTNKLFVGNVWFMKKVGLEFNYLLIEAQLILKSNSMVIIFQHRKQLPHVGGRIRIMSAVKKSVLDASSMRKRLMEINESDMMQQVEKPTGPWWQRILKCAISTSLKSASVREKSQTCPVTLSEATKKLLEKMRIMERDNTKKVKYSLLCRLIRRRLKEGLDDCKLRRLVMAVERKQKVEKCRRDTAAILSYSGGVEWWWTSDHRLNSCGRNV